MISSEARTCESSSTCPEAENQNYPATGTQKRRQASGGRVTLRDPAADGKKNGWVWGGRVSGGRGFEDIRKESYVERSGQAICLEFF